MSNKGGRYLALCGYFASKSKAGFSRIGFNKTAEFFGNKYTWPVINATSGIYGGVAAQLPLMNSFHDAVASTAIMIAGTVSAQAIEPSMNRMLNSQGVGLMRGGRIMRATQLALYGTALGASMLAINVLDNENYSPNISKPTQIEINEPISEKNHRQMAITYSMSP